VIDLKALFIWEMGEDLGHISNMLPIAKILHSKGYEIVLCFREYDNVPTFYRDVPHTCLPFPELPKSGKRTKPFLSMSDILLHRGFGDDSLLLKAFTDWRVVYDSVLPDVVVFNYSPFAMLASRGYGFKKVSVDASWGIPATDVPFVPFVNPQNFSHGWLKVSADKVLDCANRILRSYSLDELEHPSDVFQADLQIVASYQSIDIYGGVRTNGYYLGAIYKPELPVAVITGTDKKKIFCYLKEYRVATNRALSSLFLMKDFEVYAYIKGLTDPLRKVLSKQGITVYEEPVDFTGTTTPFDLVVCHGGAGTICNAIESGIPVMLFPSQGEQTLISRLVKGSSVGDMVERGDSLSTLADKMRNLVNDPIYKVNCSKLAASVSDDSLFVLLDKIT
jgi:hypothetical protein